jgi:hypothetical protein
MTLAGVLKVGTVSPRMGSVWLGQTNGGHSD